MVRFLSNENISPLTTEYVRSLGYDIKSVVDAGLRGATDDKIAAFAVSENRIIITFDLDYGAIYHRLSSGKLGVLVLRLRSQWHENVNKELRRFLAIDKSKIEKLKGSLMILSEGRYRVYKSF
ncbi:MAG: DUF5615 family PIN-like protein [Candidatus Margulisiibacteriota bacterium]